ncbi:hypothetical protein SLS60_007541 [Paraconiothyrium brasiliense]|uniref:Uncharacterized protein n=1 Tax=Paraconiothyrium brasiliense TaxID=300254 RepID=A0ABR3R5V4_9PLEO
MDAPITPRSVLDLESPADPGSSMAKSKKNRQAGEESPGIAVSERQQEGRTKRKRAPSLPRSAPPASKLIRFTRDLLTSDSPHQVLYRALENKEEWMQTVEEAEFPDNPLRASCAKVPPELALRLLEETVFAHWVQEHSLPARNQYHNPIRKFLQHPHEIAASRIIHSPSIACPDFMPAAARDEPTALRALGQALLRTADFVFGSVPLETDNRDTNELLKSFRQFAGHMSDSKAHGLTQVRRLTFPYFAQRYPPYREEAIALVRACSNLKHIRMGIEAVNVARQPFDSKRRKYSANLPEVDDFFEATGLVRLSEATFDSVTFVQGHIPDDVELLLADYSDFILKLCQKVKRSLVDAGKKGIVVQLDTHQHWNEAIEGQVQVIE